EVRHELMDPSNWFAPAANGLFMEVCPPAGKGNTNTAQAAYNYFWPTISPVATIPAAPFMLDPLGCAYPDNLTANGGTGAVSPGGQLNTAGAFGPTFFPPSAFSLDGAGGPGSIGSPAMTRITVPRIGSIFTNPGGIRFCSPIHFGLAAKIFQSSDDVLFNRPDDPTQRPIVSLPTATMPSQFSTAQGDYSWFAIIDNVQRPWDPGLDGGWGVAFTGANPTAADDNQDKIIDNASEAGYPTGNPMTEDIALWATSGAELWHVSVVVVHKRNFQLTPTTPTDVPPERMCYCDFLSAPLSPAPSNAVINNAGMGGGDAVLFVPSTLASSPDWLNVKPNQWVMMSAWPNLTAPPTGLTSPVRGQLPIVQWFRISSVGEISQTSGGWQRPVTLAGPDWNPYKFVDAIGAPAGNQSSYCTIIDGAVGVFEATIEQGQ
ncbi:MAG TPA: hypothetical protein VHC19_22005, partial [Pirellulales bacterium]|nr:hypothetical protein [Pirellulales bacterium]